MSREELNARIQKADDEISILRKDLQGFCEERRSDIQVRREGTATEATLPPVQLPIESRIRIGTIAHLLRTTLDHLVWQLVKQDGNKPGRHNAFPIYKPDFGEKLNVDRMLRGVNKTHKCIILAFSRDPSINLSPLWNLKALSNIDKHRHPILAFGVPNGLTGDYRKREMLASEEGESLPEIRREDINVAVYFRPEKDSGGLRFPIGQVVSQIEMCSAAVKAVIAYILDSTPVSWPFLLH